MELGVYKSVQGPLEVDRQVEVREASQLLNLFALGGLPFCHQETCRQQTRLLRDKVVFLRERKGANARIVIFNSVTANTPEHFVVVVVVWCDCPQPTDPYR